MAPASPFLYDRRGFPAGPDLPHNARGAGTSVLVVQRTDRGRSGDGSPAGAGAIGARGSLGHARRSILHRALPTLGLLAALAACSPDGPHPVLRGAAPPQLVPSPFLLGAEVSLTVVGAPPGETVRLVWSTAAPGSGPCPPALLGTCLDVPDAQLLVTGVADGAGTFVVRRRLPTRVPFDRLTIQAAVGDGPVVTTTPAVVVIDETTPPTPGSFAPFVPGPYTPASLTHDGTTDLFGRSVRHLLAAHYPTDGGPGIAAGRHPLLLWEHAGGDQHDDYDYVLPLLASHGIVSVSVDHSGSFESGWGADYWAAHEALFLDTLDLVRAWDAGSVHPLSNGIDLDRLAIGGHSHGAGAAMRTALGFRPADPSADLALRAVYLLAPCPETSFAEADYPAVFGALPPTATLIGSRDADGCVGDGQALATSEVGTLPRWHGTVDGADHHGFADDGGLGGATLDRASHHHAATASLHAWMARFLLDDPGAPSALHGATPLFAPPAFGGADVRVQHTSDRWLPVDRFEAFDPDPSGRTAIAGIPGQVIVNGFLSDTFVDPVAGADLVEQELRSLLPPGGGPYDVLFYEDTILGPASAYADALDRLAATGDLALLQEASGQSAFAAAIPTRPWDLVIAANQNGSASAVHPFDAPLEAWICGGGLAVVSDFRISSPTAADVLACAGVAFDGTTNHPALDAAGTTYDLANPGWGIFSTGLTTTETVLATFPDGVTAVGTPTVNDRGLPVTATGFDDVRSTPALDPARELHTPARALELAWSSPGARLEEPLTDDGLGLDLRGFATLDLRLVRMATDPLDPGTPVLDLDVVLVDADGFEAVVPLSSGRPGGMRVSPTGGRFGTHAVPETHSLPLEGFGGVDPSRVVRVELRFDRSGGGRVLVLDVGFGAR